MAITWKRLLTTDDILTVEDLYVKKNYQTFDIDYTLTGDYNGSCVGPITIADTKTLTIQDDAILVVL